MQKAAFDQTGWHLHRDICQVRVKSVCIYLQHTKWHHLYGSSWYDSLKGTRQTWHTKYCHFCQALKYFTSMTRHMFIYRHEESWWWQIGEHVVVFVRRWRFKGEVWGGGYFATTSQIVYRESGMPFESLWTQFALNILLQSNVHNDQPGFGAAQKFIFFVSLFKIFARHGWVPGIYRLGSQIRLVDLAKLKNNI